MPNLRKHLAPEPVEVLEQLAFARAGDLDHQVRDADLLESATVAAMAPGSPWSTRSAPRPVRLTGDRAQ
jgi:hypothetical protein